MDLLEQLKQQNPEAFREQRSAPMADAYGREYSGLVALAMRFSGGRIHNSKQANAALLVVALVIAVTAIYFFVSATSGGANSPIPYEATYKPLP